jgi:hypothetical protein
VEVLQLLLLSRETQIVVLDLGDLREDFEDEEGSLLGDAETREVITLWRPPPLTAPTWYAISHTKL